MRRVRRRPYDRHCAPKGAAADSETEQWMHRRQPSASKLSKREQDCCDLFDDGLAYKAIGDVMGITESTVGQNLSSALRKGWRGNRSGRPMQVADLYRRPSPEYRKLAEEALTKFFKEPVNIG